MAQAPMSRRATCRLLGRRRGCCRSSWPQQPPLVAHHRDSSSLASDLPPSRDAHFSTWPPPSSNTSSSFTLAVKDNIATAGDETTCASSMLSGYRSPIEATVVRQLRARGAVVSGRANMDEFAMGSHSTHSAKGPVVNPIRRYDSGGPFSAGGSSGGSAVAVAQGSVDVALGTDTGGSVRVPAAYTGVVGFKPSYGMLSRWGVVPYANSLDTVGLLARDVTTIRELVFGTGLDREHDPRDPTSLSAKARERCKRVVGEVDQRLADFRGRQLVVGIPVEYNIEELDPLIRQAWADAAVRLAEALGARVVPVSLPSTRHALAAYYVLAPAEASSNLAKYDGVRYGASSDSDEKDVSSSPSSPSDSHNNVLYSSTRGAGFGAEVRRRILLGTYTLSSAALDNYFIQAQRVRRLVQRDFDRVFARRNPLRDPEDQQFDLDAMDEDVGLQDKLGPVQVDFLLTPTVPTFPPALADVARLGPVDAYMNDVFTVPASLAGLPAVSIPVAPGGQGGKEDKMMAGLQLVGQHWDDERLVDVAQRLFEQVSPSREPLSPGEDGGSWRM